MVIKKSHSLTWRELTGYLFILTIFALGVVFVWMLARMFEPRGDWHDLGSVQELSLNIPSVHHLVAVDGTRISVWIVVVQNDWRAFDGRTPSPYNVHCNYGWQPITNRFEDPCTGVKFSLQGEYLKGGYYDQDRIVQNLNQYRVTVENGRVMVDLSQHIPGKKWRAVATAIPLP